jgi:CrcB protein
MLAGGLGSGARYLVGEWSAASFGAAFPYGTLIINIAGCFALGLVAGLAASGAWSPELRTAIAIGFLGGFTTYSTFNHETIALLSSGAMGAAAANIAITLVGGLVAGWLGLVVARQFVA